MYNHLLIWVTNLRRTHILANSLELKGLRTKNIIWKDIARPAQDHKVGQKWMEAPCLTERSSEQKIISKNRFSFAFVCVCAFRSFVC